MPSLLAPGSVIPGPGLVLAACDGRGGVGPNAELRVLHDTPDAPTSAVRAGGTILAADVPSKAGTGFFDVGGGPADLGVYDAGTATTAVAANPFPQGGRSYALVAPDRVAAIGPLPVEGPSGHAPAVDVRANGARVVANLACRNATDYLVVNAGDCAIEVRIANTATVVLAANASLASGSVSSAFALGSVAGVGAPLQLELVTDR